MSFCSVPVVWSKKPFRYWSDFVGSPRLSAFLFPPVGSLARFMLLLTRLLYFHIPLPVDRS